MITKPGRLRAVPRLAGKIGFDYRFDVASQVIAAGTQDVFVQPDRPAVRTWKGPDRGQGRQAAGLRRQQAGAGVLPERLGSS